MLLKCVLVRQSNLPAQWLTHHILCLKNLAFLKWKGHRKLLEFGVARKTVFKAPKYFSNIPFNFSGKSMEGWYCFPTLSF